MNQRRYLQTMNPWQLSTAWLYFCGFFFFFFFILSTLLKLFGYLFVFFLCYQKTGHMYVYNNSQRCFRDLKLQSSTVTQGHTQSEEEAESPVSPSGTQTRTPLSTQDYYSQGHDFHYFPHCCSLHLCIKPTADSNRFTPPFNGLPTVWEM